jgi:predicted MFS family arabinose efflux permease
MNDTALEAGARARSRGYAFYVLAMLLLVSTLNFVDRIVIGVLAAPIKTELGLSDTQLGLLGGTAFGLFYAALGIPIGWLADRSNRVWIMTAALALWSAFTALCGTVQSFSQLFLARLGVGIGEAGGSAPAYSLISDYFPPTQRARALAVFSFGIPIGSGLGLVLGGTVAALVDWRVTFIALGLLGLLIAPVLRATVREPIRGAFEGYAQPAPAHSVREVLATLARKPAFWALSFGGGISGIAGYGLIFWMPSFIMRSFGLTLMETSLFLGTLVFVGGTSGMWAGGWLADRLGQRGKAAYALVSAGSFVLLLPFQVGALLASSAVAAFLLLIFPEALRVMWLGPGISAVQHLVPPGMRAMASAIFLFVNNLVGLGLGSLLIGVLSDALAVRYGAESLRYAILSVMSCYAIAAALFFFASRRLERDWE